MQKLSIESFTDFIILLSLEMLITFLIEVMIEWLCLPQIKVESEKHVLFDHEFTKLFKKLEG